MGAEGKREPTVMEKVEAFVLSCFRKALGADVKKYGPVPDFQTTVEEMYGTWLTEVTARCWREALTLETILDPLSCHRQMLRRVYQRLRDRIRYEQKPERRTARLDAEALKDPKTAVRYMIELRLDLRAAMDRLSPTERRVFLLRLVDGRTFREIAEHLQMPEATVWRTHQRAVELLADVLREYR